MQLTSFIPEIKIQPQFREPKVGDKWQYVTKQDKDNRHLIWTIKFIESDPKYDHQIYIYYDHSPYSDKDIMGRKLYSNFIKQLRDKEIIYK